MSATISTAHLNNKRHSPQSLFTTRWDLPVNNNETPSPNYNDSLISLKANLDRLSFQRTLTSNPNRQSRESGLGSSVGGREEEFPTQFNSDIRGLLDQLDTCWNKVQQQNLRIPTTIDRPHPANDVAASNISIRERTSIESNINYGHSKSSTITNPFKKLGHRRHRIINPPTASPHSSSSSVISLDPNTSYPTNPPASSSGQTLGELKESSSISGWLVKLYVINPSLLARKQWKRRYFCLHDNVLYRFKSSCSSSLPTDKMTIDPESIICVSDGFSGKKRVFQVKTGEECWFLQAETTVQLKSWLQGLKSIHANPINTHN
ncbi:PH-domain-containing protein, partial [Conidiobolus coronatus NRRL 28638]